MSKQDRKKNLDKNELIEARLREISDKIVQLKVFLELEPANGFLIELLELERATILKDVIRIVP